MNYYFKVLKNYATFSGRARRKEYWMFVLFNTFFQLQQVLLKTTQPNKTFSYYQTCNAVLLCIYMQFVKFKFRVSL